MNGWSEAKARGFVAPTTLPDRATAPDWGRANRDWWESNPMRYDWRSPIAAEPLSQAWFAEIDRRFFESARVYMPWTLAPFDQLIPYRELSGKRVLEIGVGMGSHAQLLARAAGSFIGIELTEYAAKATRRRLELAGLPGQVCRMDAERLALADASTDLVWSWGVIHHSPNTRQALSEIHRVLKPGGTAITMVYHRSLWLWWVVGFALHGILRGRLAGLGTVHRVVQEVTDGAIARYYTPKEWRMLCREFFTVERLKVYGAKHELVPLPQGRLKSALMALLPDALVRLICNRLRFGSFLVTVLRKAPAA
jgi:SAM-dependent methyltransferase